MSTIVEAIEAVGAVRNQEINDMLDAKDILAEEEQLAAGVGQMTMTKKPQWQFYEHIKGT